MSVPTDWSNFCLNKNASNFFTKYVWNENYSVFNPCFLSLLITISHLSLLLLTKYYFCNLGDRLLTSSKRSAIVAFKFGASFGTFTAILTLILTRHLVDEYKIQEIDTFWIAVNSYLAYVWAMQSILWAISYCKSKMLHSKFLNISYLFCFVTFWLKLYQICAMNRFDMFCFWNLTVCLAQLCYLCAIFAEIYLESREVAQDTDTERLLDDSGQPIISLGAGDQEAGPISRLNFWWTNELMRKGYLGQLNSVEDLYRLPSALKVETCQLRVEKKHKNTDRFVLWRVLVRTFGLEYFLLGILKFVADNLNFAGPILLHYLVTFMQNKLEPMRNGYFYVLGMAAAAFVAAFCSVHFNYFVTRVALKLRATLVTCAYGKLLKVSLANLAGNGFSTGQLLNFMSTDTDRIVNFCPSFHAFWSLPIQLAIALYLLHREVGLAFLTGLGFAIILVPINKWITVKIGKLSQKMMEWKDKRVKAMTELLFGIRVIKLSAWESHFITKINKLRAKELQYLKGRKYLDAICVYLWASAPVVIAILTFVTYTLMGNQLTAAKVFTSLALINILIMPLNAFPWVLMGLIEAWVSVKRVQRFLQLPEIDHQVQYTILDDPKNALDFLDASFSWNFKTEPTLKHIDLSVPKGKLIGLIGAVGTGKTSLLHSILGEIHKISGQLVVGKETIEEGFGIFTQEVWLRQGTARENILLGKDFDKEFYEQVVHACALESDFELMPKGDLTEISEGGVTLSGGQKARLALARAVYQDKQLYLLDDPLSAVDSNVAQHIWQHCICDILRKKGKTVILATHHVHFLLEADWVIDFDTDGTIAKYGAPSEVLGDSVSKSHYKIEQNNGESSENGGKMENFETVLVQEEEKEIGRVRMGVYCTYLRSIGIVLSIAIFLSLFLMQASKNVTDWWLSYWVGQEPQQNASLHLEDHYRVLSLLKHPFSLFTSLQTAANSPHSHNVTFYLTVYGSLAGANSIFTLSRAFLFAYGGIVAAKAIHEHLLHRIMQATFRFFDTTPVGRIVNRFSSDLYAIDETLPFQSNILLAFLFGVLGSIITMCYALPWFAICVLVVAVLYYFIQNYYRYTTCELKRLNSVSLSPIYSHFTESVSGLSTIRALRCTRSFMSEMRCHLTLNLRAQFSTLACSQWLSVRLQLIGVAMVTSVGFIAVLQHHFQSVDPGLVGLAISYGLSLTSMMSGLVQYFTETEKELVSVERVNDYVHNVTTESNQAVVIPDDSWPETPSIEFRDVSLRYGPGSPLVLDGIDFTVNPGEKIGIIGRTGSGKSSLLQALFRAVELESGSIFVDDIDVCTVDLQTLRSRICIIPQTPLLFDGSLRENVDVLGLSSDDEVLDVIEKCRLGSLLERLGGLYGNIGTDNGLSMGQKQLLCLARAMLSGAKVVCMDEATAQVDRESEKQVQHILDTQFSHCTLLTIAHRLDTVAEYERIFVMDKGKLIAQGEPQDVLGVI